MVKNQFVDFKFVLKMAEREGFEPSIGLTLRRISSAVHSTTLPPLRRRAFYNLGLVNTRLVVRLTCIKKAPNGASS